MRAGRLRHRVVIEGLVDNQGADGSIPQTWEPVATVWAGVEPLSGRERFAAEQVQSQVDARIVIRYRAGVTAAMRVRFGAVIYSIEAVINPEQRHRELHLLCSEGLNDG